MALVALSTFPRRLVQAPHLHRQEEASTEPAEEPAKPDLVQPATPGALAAASEAFHDFERSRRVSE